MAIEDILTEFMQPSLCLVQTVPLCLLPPGEYGCRITEMIKNSAQAKAKNKKKSGTIKSRKGIQSNGI